MLQIVKDSERKIINSCLLNRTAYNIPLFITFHRGLNIPKMYHLLTQYFEQHAIFRTSYRIDTEIYKSENEKIPTIEIQSFSNLDKEELCKKHLISIEDPELVRVVLCKVTNEPYDVMFLNIHHVLLDGFSVQLFLQKLIEAYLSEQPIDLRLSQFNELAQAEAAASIANNSISKNIRFEHYDAFKLRLMSKQSECIHYVDELIDLPEKYIQRFSDFALCLTAFSISMAGWLNSNAIYMAYPYLGRDKNNYKVLGNFVQLLPFQHNFEQEYDMSLDQITAHIQDYIFTMMGNSSDFQGMLQEQMNRMNIFRDIMFDYKSGSLISKVLNEEHSIELEEAGMYRDEKYGMHFSIYKNQNQLEIHVISSEYELEHVQYLITSFKKIIHHLYLGEYASLSELITITDIEEEKPKTEQSMHKQDHVYEEVVRIVKSLLKEEAGMTVGRNESFFDLGMDSVLLVKFKKRVKEKFDINLKISDFFNHYTSELLTQKIINHLKEVS